MFIIAGLGNPTKEYNGTRHNIGFDGIVACSDKWRIPVDKVESKAIVGKGVVGAERVLLVKPQTYMNLSGESLGPLASYYRVDPSQVIVLVDDINLEPGQLRIRAKGSAGGHNGLKSIIAHLGTEDFIRIRIGVGEKPANWDLADWVLGRFPKEQEPLMREALAEVVAACEMIMTEGIEKAMGKYNQKKASPEEEEAKKLKAQKRMEEQKKRRAEAEARKAAAAAEAADGAEQPTE